MLITELRTSSNVNSDAGVIAKDRHEKVHSLKKT